MSFQQRTYNMQAGQPFAIQFTTNMTVVSLLARAECYVQTPGNGSFSPGNLPQSSPAPSAGNSANWLHLLAGEQQTIGGDPLPASTDTIGWILVWPVAAGELVVIAH